MRIKIFDITNNQTTDVDKALRYTHGRLTGFTASWSPDSRWLAYNRDMENQHNAVFIYDYQNKKDKQVTGGFYECNSPVFDADGKYLYIFTGQSFRPNYSDIDNTFIYANTTQIAAISLKKETPSLLAPKNDTVAVKTDDAVKDENKDKNKKDTAATKKPETKTLEIDFDGIEQRMEILPPVAGNYGALAIAKGKIIYIKYPNTGSSDGKGSLKYFDLDKKEEKTIIDNVDNARLSANGQKILITKSGSYAVISSQEGQKGDKTLRLDEMQMTIDPVQEWKQIFMDAWRLERDYFYDAGMHGVDWNLAKERYLKMLNGAMTREEVDFIIGELIGELNASHTYHGGGDIQTPENKLVGYLGVDWQADGDFYKIKKIIRGAAWDAEARSSLDLPGVNIKEGDYILAVNGVPLTSSQEPYSAFAGLSNKTVEITYNSTPSWTGAKTTIVKTMNDEYRLRHLAWIESMRKKVEEETNGEAGYIYVPSTGVDGQNELIRQFNAQWDKKALVIDERFNDGGQIPDRFIEMLNRDPLAYWAIRDGSDWPWPPFANFGPKVMLINGWSGSGGDAFPDYFRRKKLGPLIGARTWGGLIGISGVPGLADGGNITVPTFRMYNPDGTWFMEGHGVDPDIAVPEDLSAMAKGTDTQLEKAITEIKNQLKTKGYQKPARPPMQKRGF
jgi:tricorn protease